MSTKDNFPPAAESIAGNDDLLTQILSRLPVRPLIRFKCVSKRWLNLISDRSFSQLHSRLHPQRSCSAILLFHRRFPAPRAFDFIPLRADDNRSSRPPFFSNLESSRFKILQSCNGLLLLGSLVPRSEFSYFVCNPTTNQISRLPVPNEIVNGNLSVAGVSIAFDPKKFEGHKVICVSKSNSVENQHEVDIYSPGIGQWRRAIDCNPKPLPHDTEFARGVYCDGKIHWLSRTQNSVFFDLESEILCLLPLPLPSTNFNFDRFCYFGESMGHLYLIGIPKFTRSELSVLELNKETLVWFVKYTRINLEIAWRQLSNDFKHYPFKILAAVRDENWGDEDLVLLIPGKVINYNFRTRLADCVYEVGDESSTRQQLGSYKAFQFIESLYCV